MSVAAQTSPVRTPNCGPRRVIKVALICLLQVAALVALAESAVRLGGYDQPLAGAIAFASESGPNSIHETDACLFYRLRPNLHTRWQGSPVNTNRLGLRGAEVEGKSPREFRILSVGESTTFGAGVADDETYSAQLERLLQERDPEHRYRVINAGVSGYSSLQSLTYLERRGFDLQPDLVLFYHEINDSLPATYSDRELLESRSQAWHRGLTEWSAVYRAISAAAAARKIAAQRAANPAQQAGTGPGAAQTALLNSDGLETAVGRVRVSSDERRQIFQQLSDLCRSRGATLVLIHPAYAESTRHSCELTDFCATGGHLLYEAYDSLHPEGTPQRALFLDECHPNSQGHRALALGLCDFLVETRAVPVAQ